RFLRQTSFRKPAHFTPATASRPCFFKGVSFLFPVPSTLRHTLGLIGAPIAALAFCACVTLTELPRGVSPASDGTLRATAIGCGAVIVPPAASDASALDPGALRVLTWTLHKQDEAGWDRDLARFLDGA